MRTDVGDKKMETHGTFFYSTKCTGREYDPMERGRADGRHTDLNGTTDLWADGLNARRPVRAKRDHTSKINSCPSPLNQWSYHGEYERTSTVLPSGKNHRSSVRVGPQTERLYSNYSRVTPKRRKPRSDTIWSTISWSSGSSGALSLQIGSTLQFSKSSLHHTI